MVAGEQPIKHKSHMSYSQYFGCRAMFKLDIGFYIGNILRALLESLHGIHVLLANQ